MADRPDVPLPIVERIRATCVALPETVEEAAWIGARWRIRTNTFAHVLLIDEGRPASYARAAGTNGPLCVLTFQSSGPELQRLREAGEPYFAPVWRPGIIGLRIDSATDWDEVAELLTDSYCTLAPKRLVRLLERPVE